MTVIMAHAILPDRLGRSQNQWKLVVVMLRILLHQEIQSPVASGTESLCSELICKLSALLQSYLRLNIPFIVFLGQPPFSCCEESLYVCVIESEKDTEEKEAGGKRE